MAKEQAIRQKSTMTFRDDVREVVADMLEGRGDVRAGQMMGLPTWSCVANRKMFIGVHGGGINLKLPKERVEQLLVERPNETSRFKPGERVMSGWVQIDHANPEDFEAEAGLIEEAIAYVSAL